MILKDTAKFFSYGILSAIFFLILPISTVFAYTPDIGSGYHIIISGAGQSISNGTYEPYGVLDLAGHGRQGYFNGTQYLVWCSNTEMDINDTTGPCTTDYYWDSGGDDSKLVSDTSLWHAIATSPAPTSVVIEEIGGGGGGDATSTVATTTDLIIATNNNTFGLAMIFFILCLFTFAYFGAGYTKKR